MRRIVGLWLLSLVMVGAVSSALTIVVVRRTTTPFPRASAALPWSMGVKSVVKGPNDSSHARGAFINLPVSCDGFSPPKRFSWRTKSSSLVCRTHAETWMLNFEETSTFGIPCCTTRARPSQSGE